jgi:hypothetical protein
MSAGSNSDNVARAKHLRNRAGEVRTAGEGMQSVPARTTMVRIAETYERLANHLDGEPKSKKETE